MNLTNFELKSLGIKAPCTVILPAACFEKNFKHSKLKKKIQRYKVTKYKNVLFEFWFSIIDISPWVGPAF